MDAEAGRHWLENAKCQDPFRVGCQWSGRLWIELKPVENCMPCPSCGGYSFAAKVSVRWMTITRRLIGWMDALEILDRMPK
jgi:hypothetical protein